MQEAENAANTKLNYQDYLHRLLEKQVLSKIERSINRHTQPTCFPQVKRLEEFDFTFEPKINEKLTRKPATLEFMDSAKNILFVGATGVGKTHPAVSIGIKAAHARKRELSTAEQLTQDLGAAEVLGHLNKMLEMTTRIELLIIDELGYLSLTMRGAASCSAGKGACQISEAR